MRQTPPSDWPPPAQARDARRLFWTLFALVLATKLLVAARLPVFVDEAFYTWHRRIPTCRD